MSGESHIQATSTLSNTCMQVAASYGKGGLQGNGRLKKGGEGRHDPTNPILLMVKTAFKAGSMPLGLPSFHQPEATCPLSSPDPPRPTL